MILVTGATGFLGKNLVIELRNRGEPVRALVRPTSLKRRRVSSNKEDTFLALKELGVELVYGDITDETAVLKAMDGCQTVFHTAALVKTWVRDRLEYDRVNVAGLGNILNSAKKANIQKVIYTSSFIALGPTDGTIADENYSLTPRTFHNDYERTKYLADQLARKYANDGFPLVILYPGVIYGPGELTQGNIVVNLIQQYLKRKLPGLLGDGSKQWNYGYIDNVVNGHILALEKALPGARYILGGENASMQTFIALLEELSGVPAPKWHIPYWLAELVAIGEELAAYLFNREPKNTRGTIEIYKHDWTYTSAKAERELGYSHISLREGLSRTLEWLKTVQCKM
ncbi:MAG: SDR family oxidoreductase [bacterium]|nr:SDR family oxidoreductase [bacterium]